MLEQARARLAAAPPGRVTWLERTASEVDGLPEADFDAVVAGLCLSEMSAGERAFVLRALTRCLRPGGVLAVGDEVQPRRTGQRALHALLRAPQAAVAWLLTGSTSRPVPDLAAEVAAAGLEIRSEQRWLLGRLAAVVAECPR
jgi:ubiquinone/menaquinone biosynthesis C-methylase UbiE